MTEPERAADPVSDGVSPSPLAVRLYDELRGLAERRLGREPVDLTLQPTALVHEAWLRLADDEGALPESDCTRTRFLAMASSAMRRVLIDHARRRRASKRGGGWQRVTLAAVAEPSREVDLVALAEAMERLAALNPRHGRVAELRFLAGLTVEETAEVLAVSPRTVKLDWRMARAWLMNELETG